MVLYTIVSEYDIFRGNVASPPIPGEEKSSVQSFQGRYFECESSPDGMRMRRMISTNPADYLKPGWQPGARLPGNLVGKQGTK